MEHELTQHLIALAGAYGTAKGLMLSTVAKHITGDPRFFTNLENGLTFTARRYDKVVAAFAANWPQGLDWPDGVPRPTLEAAE
ncbi:MAG: hypothetical protein H6873_05500 [Hyphomicrobiaceae bacterium]|nr:hypothetical protein [Hyphomicrobiaceae bacterium]